MVLHVVDDGSAVLSLEIKIHGKFISKFVLIVIIYEICKKIKPTKNSLTENGKRTMNQIFIGVMRFHVKSAEHSARS